MKVIPWLRLAGFVGLGLVLLGTGGCSKKTRSARYTSRGEAFVQSAEFSKAEIEFRNALRLDPQNARAIRGIGVMFFQQGRIGMAIPVLLKARELDPTDPTLRLVVARLSLLTGSLADAQKESEILLKQDPRHPLAPVILAEATAGESENLKLKQRFEQMAASGDTAALQMGLGLVEFHLGNEPGAEAAFQRAVQLDPASYHARLGLAGLAQKRGETARVDDYTKEAAKLAPRRTVESLAYARLKLNAGDTAAAGKLLADLAREAPDYLPIWRMQAEVAAGEKRYEDCAKLVEKILTEDPFQPGTMMLSGRLDLLTGDKQKAIATFERMAKLFPRSAWVQHQLALAYLETKDPAKAADALNRAIGLDPAFPDPVYLLVRLQSDKKDFDSAILALKKLLEKNANLPRARALLAEMHLLRGNVTEAIQIDRELLAANPRDTAVLWAIGLAYLQVKSLDEARDAFQRLLVINPADVLALEQLVNLDLPDKKYSAAQERIDQFRKANPKVAEVVLLEAKIQFAQKRLAEAEGMLLGLLQAHPESRAARIMLIRYYRASGRDADSIAQLRLLVEQSPTDLESVTALASLQQAAGSLAEARANYEKVLAAEPANGVALNNVANIYVELGELDKALVAARKAREMMPHQAPVADTLGWVLYKQRQLGPALQLCQEAAEKAGNDPDVAYHLGKIRYDLGLEDAARAAFETAVKFGAKSTWLPDAEAALKTLTLVAQDDSAELRSQLMKRAAEPPDDPIVLHRLAAMEERSGNHVPAVALLNRVLVVNPDHVGSLTLLARISAFNLGDLAKGMEYAKALQRLRPDDPAVNQLAGRIAYLAGSFQWSVSLLRRAALAGKAGPELQFNLAEAELAVGRTDAAVTAMNEVMKSRGLYLREEEAGRFLALLKVVRKPVADEESTRTVAEALKRDPRSPAALLAAGMLASARGDSAAAVGYYETALAAAPEFLPAKKALAAAYVWENRKLDKAFELATQVRTALPDDQELVGVFGVLLYQRGDYQKAVTQLLQGLRSSDDARLVFYLGMAQYQAGDLEGARTSLNRALVMKGLPGHMAVEAHDTLDTRLSSPLSAR